MAFNRKAYQKTAKGRAYTERYRRKRRQWFKELKEGLACACGETHPACLDFHHRDPASKKFALGSNRTMSKENILAEIEKCDVLCANCHRKLHYALST